MVTALPNAYFGAGNGSVAAYNFGCVGTENNLTACSFEFNDANSACDHSQDASVVCETILSELTVNLKNSNISLKIAEESACV